MSSAAISSSRTPSAAIPGLPGAQSKLRSLWRARERADERVLATTGADDEDAHHAAAPAVLALVAVIWAGAASRAPRRCEYGTR